MKILFLGLGGVGQRHLRNIDLLSKGTNNEYLTVSKKKQKFEISNQLDINEKINIFQKYKLKTFISIEDALLEKPDLTIISTPSSLHYEQAKLALLSGSHVFVEKPVTMNSKECEKLIELSKNTNKKIAISFQLRFTPWINEIKQIINSEEFGLPVFVNCCVSEYMPLWHKYEDYRNSYAARKDLGGGVIFTQIHELDYLTYIFGNLDYKSSISGKFSDLEIDVEDTSFSLLMGSLKDHKFPISVAQDYLGNPKKRELTIQFNYAKVHCDLIKGEIQIHEKNKEKNIKDFSSFERNNAFLNQMEIFLDSLKKEDFDPPVNLADGYKSLLIAEKIKNNMNY